LVKIENDIRLFYSGNLNCQSKGCSICQKTGWVEIIGAGMVYSNVFKNSGLKLWLEPGRYCLLGKLKKP